MLVQAKRSLFKIKEILKLTVHTTQFRIEMTVVFLPLDLDNFQMKWIFSPREELVQLQDSQEMLIKL